MGNIPLCVLFLGKLFSHIFMNAQGHEHWRFVIKFTVLLVVIIDKDIKSVILRRYNSANGMETYKIDYMSRLAFNEG